MNFSKFLFVVLLFALFLSACQDEIDPRSGVGFETEFYPTEVGKFWEYKVDSTTFAIQGSIKKQTTGYIREEVVDRFIDATGDTIARIDRYWKRNINGNWRLQQALSATISGQQAIRTEDNLRFIKLTLPPTIGARWDSNSFIDAFQDIEVAGEFVQIFKDWDDAEVMDRQTSTTIGDKSYSDVITVLLTDSDSFIERRFAQEQYAKGVGLVSADYIILDTQCSSCTEQTWEEKAEQGFILKQVLINHN